MKLFTQDDINWSESRLEQISADRNDLPANIRAIRAPDLTDEALQTAFALCAGPVQLVQIETPISDEEQRAAIRLATRLRHTKRTADGTKPVKEGLRWDKPRPSGQLSPQDFLQSQFLEIFGTSAQNDPDIQSLMRRFNKMVLCTQAIPPNLVRTILSAGIASQNRYRFHSHGNEILEQEAWYWNYTLGRRSSVFIDSADIVPPAELPRGLREKLANPNNPYFKNPQPVLWQGIPWSNSLFNAGAQAGGNIAHSVPLLDHETDSRMTMITTLTNEALS